MAHRTFLYHVNVTRDCNLRCTHCYISSIVKKHSGEMERQNVINIAHGIVKHMERIGYDLAEIHLIGGEPTQLGVDFFEYVIPEMRKILDGRGFKYKLCLVSNLIHPEIVRIASLFDQVATSWEPETRFPKAKLEQMWRKSMQRLRDAGIKFGCTTAVTKPLIKMGVEAMMQKLYYEEGIKNMHFGFFIPSGDGLDHMDEIFPAFHETSAFLIDVANWYRERRLEDPDLYVNPAESLLQAIHTNQPVDDIVCPIIAGSMDINWDGNAISCIEAGGNTEVPWSGNVYETSVDEVSQTASFKRDVINARKPHKACIGCDAYQFCRSGCGVLAKYWDPEKDTDCPGFKGFIDHVRTMVYDGVRPKALEFAGGHAGC
jgi:radical SAM protein with 4Fe4S-binding SPASM domain